MNRLIVIGDVLRANINQPPVFKPQVNVGKWTKGMRKSVKIIKATINRMYLCSPRNGIRRKVCVALILKLEEQSWFRPKRNDIVRPATMRSAGVALQNNVGGAVTVHVFTAKNQ